ncbi:MAG: helix-turn-helix transcriptional regulator [Verrucomicrobiae bacterium]|nr:helix-turn-helix transcriptional regulator [Verrucomicrobiae bacterium]
MPDNVSIVPLYGDPKRSGFWVVNLEVSDDGRSTTLNFAGDQIVFVCLRAGSVWLEDGQEGSLGLSASQMGVLATSRTGSLLRRNGASDGIVVGFQKSVLTESLERHRAAVPPSLTGLVFSPRTSGVPPIAEPLPDHIRGRWMSEFRQPPVMGNAVTFWYESKVREFIAICCFSHSQAQSGFFCARQKRLAADRIQQVRTYLEAHLDEPFSLPEIAAHVGCSSHYLSRTFSEATGMTISQYLRGIRIEKAARLIAGGRHNVSEAAVEVGYQSLSHFSKAFLKEKGCLPSQFTGS